MSTYKFFWHQWCQNCTNGFTQKKVASVVPKSRQQLYQKKWHQWCQMLSMQQQE